MSNKNQDLHGAITIPHAIIMFKLQKKQQRDTVGCKTFNTMRKSALVGGFNPFEKYARQNGFIFPNVRGENKKDFKPPPRK